MTNGKVARARRKQQAPSDREGQGPAEIVRGICRDCARFRDMKAVYRICHKCLTKRLLAELEEEFPAV